MKDRLLLHVIGDGDLWVKLTLSDSRPRCVIGYEVYNKRPSLQYWTENYGHGEPPILEVTTPSYVELHSKFGECCYLHIWPTMNIGPSAGIEPIRKINPRSTRIGLLEGAP